MDVIVISNGLGNQMSQYAFYMHKKKISKSTFVIPFCKDHNGFELSRAFGIDIENRFFNKFLYLVFRLLLTERLRFLTGPLQSLLKSVNCKIVKEDFNYNFNEERLKPCRGITFYYGGWHAQEYFLPVKNEVLSAFNFSAINDVINLKYINEIHSSNSVSIHIRRGDYLDDRNIELFGGVCDKTYFETAMRFIEDERRDLHFFIFSDDSSWAKSNITASNVTFISCNKGIHSWKDMYLISICKHNIISNSTFSWWGAWLNRNFDKVVIAPDRFLKGDKIGHIYPDSWRMLTKG